MTDAHSHLPDGPLVAWYGDDFTGAAAVMEVLTFAGLPSILFLAPPSAEQLARFKGLRGVGVASTARALSPEGMERELPQAFAQLAALRPELLQYKICTTLDSAPEIGSIGKAIEIGAGVCDTQTVPVLTAAPQMGRYQFFGHLFAAMGEEVYRIDRHPVMSRHPVTPMDDSDVAAHIAKQSNRLDISPLSAAQVAGWQADLPRAGAQEGRITAFALDSFDAASEAAAGRMIWEGRAQSRFVIGSQGVEYALVRHWIACGLLAPRALPASLGRAARMVAVSGSVSPTTAAQIAWAKANGFASIPFDATSVCVGDEAIASAIAQALQAALQAIQAGQDPLIHTAEGPDDPAVERFRAAVAGAQIDMPAANQKIGEALGLLLRQILDASGVRRAVVSGGDTSGHATRQLGIFALEALAPTLPGAAICKAYAHGPMDGLELALKGGQMGSEDYFGWVREGGGPR